MYFIGLRDGSPVSVGRMGEFKGEEDLTVNLGTLVSLDENGKLTAFAETAAPFGVVSSSHKDGVAQEGEEIIVMQTTGDMYLDATVSGTDEQIAALVDGKYIKATATGVDASDTSDFCRIVSTNGAKTAGDRILVRFEYDNKA